MFLRRLYLNGFRNYTDAHFAFSPGTNIIYGDNAQGKTNLLEAIHFLITGRSFRTTHLGDLIQHDRNHFYLEAHFTKRGVDQKLRITFDGKEKKIIYNSTPCPSISALLGLLHGVTMTPDDVALIKGAPQARRHFLDLHIAQHSPLYIHHLTRYHGAMRQRNHLLRTRNPTSIESWEHEMASAAAHLTQQRSLAIEELAKEGQPLHHCLSGRREKLSLHYRTQMPHQSSFEAIKLYHIEQLKKQRKREMDLGQTVTGPHKDDLLIMIDHNETRFFASEGQQRSCLGALRLAEWKRLNALVEAPPLMLIDDIGSCLDAKRRWDFLAQLNHLGQVFISSTEQLHTTSANREIHYFKIEEGREEDNRPLA